MAGGFISRGFRGRREQGEQGERLPPGQYLERGFPVLSAGPTPHTPLDRWTFSITGEVDKEKRSRGVCGVGPADNTGKSLTTYWPGGRRPAVLWSRGFPRNPGEMNVMSCEAP